MTRFGFVRDAISRPETFWRGLGVTALAIGLATGLRWILGTAADPVPFVTYFPAVVLCTLFAGWRAGVASIFLSATIVNIVFLGEPMRITTGVQTVAMISLFFLSCLLLVAIAQTLRKTFRDLSVAKERSDFLNRELQHRVRNTLSIVQALAAQSVRSDPQNFQSAFASRLSALADAHDVLSRGTSDTCELETVVQRSCEAFHHDGNFDFEGPPCRLSSETCPALSMALHELCTNALKHGALSVPQGRVHVSWGEPWDNETTLIWQEEGGPEVRAPTRKGLGTILLTSQPEIGKADLQFHPGGLRCEMKLRVAS
jgi:two-component sensor histidine kinase